MTRIMSEREQGTKNSISRDVQDMSSMVTLYLGLGPTDGSTADEASAVAPFCVSISSNLLRDKNL